MMNPDRAYYFRGIADWFIQYCRLNSVSLYQKCAFPGLRSYMFRMLSGIIYVLVTPGLYVLSGLTNHISETNIQHKAASISGLFSSQEAFAQRNPAFYSYPHNHLDWYTIESDNFMVHYQEGNSRPAQVISRIAEEIYEPITDLYNHEPDQKVSILLIDRLDYSNGAAFFYDNKIEIWLPALGTPLRGTHNWLRNVITHEFTHIVQIQSSMKWTRRRPAVYLQWLSYEDVRRPDVLYGFPNGIISYPLSGISMPAWMAEGTAQFMREELFYDDWDSHRDMLLRTRILDNTQLSLEKMGTFSSKTSLERELTYNQGFAFTRYLADRFGEHIVADISRELSNRGVYNVSNAIKNATGIDGGKVYDDWISELKVYYSEFAEDREMNPAGRTWIEQDGFYNFHPVFDPDGQKIAYLSNKMTDGSMAGLYVRNFEDSTGVEENGENNGKNRNNKSGVFETRLYETPSLSHASSGNRSGLSGTPNTRQRGHPSSSQLHECSLNDLLVRRLETSFSYSPDGKRIAYSRARLNEYGEQYRDLYLYDTDSKSSKRLTFSGRIQDPAWSPDGRVIATGKIEDGSVNLYFYHIEQDSMYRITDFQHGQQIYRPVWHPDGETIFFAYADTAQRGIYKISFSDTPADPENTTDTNPSDIFNSFDDFDPPSAPGLGNMNVRMTHVLTDSVTDYRDPVVSSDGQWLYFSADGDGVYNIYRKSLLNEEIQQVTNVVGGAFMPFPHPDKEQLLYSEFTSEGYKIALLDLRKTNYTNPSKKKSPSAGIHTYYPVNHSKNTSQLPAHSVSQTEPGVSKGSDSPDESDKDSFVRSINRFDDSDITSFPPEVTAVADTGIYHYQLPTRGASSDRQFYKYNDQFTSFHFYPVLRFDNYSRIRGRNTTLLTSGKLNDLGANLWRDFKFGTYFASREIRERFSVFGGVLIGPGSRSSNGVSDFLKPSRVVNLDRDLFFQAEYTGLPFIKRYWSPTVSVEFFNIRRNVQNGMQIEEFPCTGCLPDTTSIDIAYNMWEGQLNLISKVNRWSVAEIGIHYSPYRVSTESFFSREYKQEVPGSTSRYYIGSTWSAAWSFDLSVPDRHSDIAPTGWRGLLRYQYEPSELLSSYDVNDGMLIPVYNNYDNHSFETDLRYGADILSQRFNIRSRFFSYLDGPDEFFYLDYIGGLVGMRSYPFFALGGTTTAFSQLSWFIPLKTNIYHQINRVTLDKIFLRLFAEAGNAWGGPLDINKSIKSGIGAELRVAMNSYYLFPTSFFISGAYGFNSYDLRIPDAFISETPSGRISFGNQILINFGILFDFEF